MSKSSTNRIRTIPWLLLGTVFGMAVTLGLFFGLSGFKSDQVHGTKSDAVVEGDTFRSDQDPSYPTAKQNQTAAAQNLLDEHQLEAAWYETISDDRPNVAQLADLISIANSWMKESGLDVIQEISDSLSDSIVRNAVVKKILHTATQSDPQNALQYALELSDPLREIALSAVASAWTNMNPIQALNYVSTIDSGSVRRQMLEKLVRSWAEHNPKAVLDEIELVPENLRNLGEREALLALARTAPEETVALLNGISDTELKLALTMELASNWSDLNLEAALEWAMSEDVLAKDQVLTLILGKLARRDPKLALQTALSQPMDNSLFGLELSVLTEVAAFDLELAVEMLSQVRDGLTKFFSYSAVARRLVRNNQIDRVHDLALGLPEDERGAYYNRVVHQWAVSQPESLVDQLENLPSTEAKYEAAMGLVRRNVGTNVLSKTQMDYVRSFLPEDYNSETGRRGSERHGSGYIYPGLTDKQNQIIREHYTRILEERADKDIPVLGTRIRN